MGRIDNYALEFPLTITGNKMKIVLILQIYKRNRSIDGYYWSCKLKNNIKILFTIYVWEEHTQISVHDNGHGPIWSINDQTHSTTNNESNVISYRYFYIKIYNPE